MKSIILLSTLFLCNIAIAQQKDSSKYVLNSVSASQGAIRLTTSYTSYASTNKNFPDAFPNNDKNTYNYTLDKYMLSSFNKIGVSISERSKNEKSYYESSEIGIQLSNLQSNKLVYSKYSNVVTDTIGDTYYFERKTSDITFSELHKFVSMYFGNSYSVPLGKNFRVALGYGSSVGFEYSAFSEMSVYNTESQLSSKHLPFKIDSTLEHSNSNYSELMVQVPLKPNGIMLQLTAPIHIDYTLSDKKFFNKFLLFYELAPSINMLFLSNNVISMENSLSQEIGLKYMFLN